jgi:hypothetical protein
MYHSILVAAAICSVGCGREVQLSNANAPAAATEVQMDRAIPNPPEGLAPNDEFILFGGILSKLSAEPPRGVSCPWSPIDQLIYSTRTVQPPAPTTSDVVSPTLVDSYTEANTASRLLEVDYGLKSPVLGTTRIGNSFSLLRSRDGRKAVAALALSNLGVDWEKKQALGAVQVTCRTGEQSFYYVLIEFKLRRDNLYGGRIDSVSRMEFRKE